MYKEKELLQVAGHTSVERNEALGNVLSCDNLSTYRSGEPIALTCNNHQAKRLAVE